MLESARGFERELEAQLTAKLEEQGSSRQALPVQGWAEGERGRAQLQESCLPALPGQPPPVSLPPCPSFQV